MKTPRENPDDKAARLRERRMSELERSRTVQTQARDLTGDVRRIYGNRVSMFGLVKPKGSAAPSGKSSTPLPWAQGGSFYGGNRE